MLQNTIILIVCPTALETKVRLSIDFPELRNSTTTVFLFNPKISQQGYLIAGNDSSAKTYDLQQISLVLTYKVESTHPTLLYCQTGKVKTKCLLDWLEFKTKLVPFELMTLDEIKHLCETSPLVKYYWIKLISEWLLIAILSPFLLLGLAIGFILACSDGLWQPFYRAVRCGKNNQPITLTKFRTMKLNAFSENRAYSLPNDERITPIGRLLRASKLDELPQILDVLRGDMTLIGPRPELFSNIDAHLSDIIVGYGYRHTVKPGITGWAQVTTGYPFDFVGFIKRHSADLFYLKHWSLLLDLKILWLTCTTIVTKIFGAKTYTQNASGWDQSRLMLLELNQRGNFIVVDIDQQQLSHHYYIQNSDELVIKNYAISTSSLGGGNVLDSYKTPLGCHKIAEKIGAGEPPGRVFKARVPTAEISAATMVEKGDIITSRIMWLSGAEPGINKGDELDSYARYIYIHGTPYEHLLGTPVSKGCIRMSNVEVIELFDNVSVETKVMITSS